MTGFQPGRRAVFKGLGALGVVSVLTGCLETSGSTGSGTGTATSNPGSGPGLGSPGGVAGVSTLDKIIIDAGVDATGIPVTVPIYAYVTGLVKVPGQVFYRYDAASGKPVQMSTSDNTITDSTKIDTGLSGATYTQNYPSAWANYSIVLDRSGPTVAVDLASFNGTNIPGFGTGPGAFSGRIWISVGKPLIPFTPRVGASATAVGTVDGYTTPVVAAGGVGAHCFYDWLEFSYDVNKLLYINTTQVDQYGFPVSLSATGDTVSGSPQGVYNKKRSEILTQLAGHADPLFNTSVLLPVAGVAVDAYPPTTNTQGKLRALAPSKTAAVVGSTYLDAVISAALLYWKGTWLEVTCSSNAAGHKTYYGQTQADNKTLNFYLAKDASGAVQFSFDDITTQNVLDCDGKMTGVGVPQVGDTLTNLKNTGKAILAGFNRGVITATTAILNIDAGATYSPPLSGNYPAGGTFNQWAQDFHTFSTSGLAYGFAYDDVGDQQPMIIATKTTGLKLTLGKFE